MMAKIRVRNTPQVALVDTELEELLRDGAVEFECSLNDSLSKKDMNLLLQISHLLYI